MKATLICTLKNERKHLKEFLNSIKKQGLKPDEIIFVDGGSDDGTVEMLKSFAKRRKRVFVFVEPGLNIAQGRNFAIKKARNSVIAATDAGCILEKNWFKSITSHFPKYDVVAGVFEPHYDNTFQKAQGAIVCKDISKLDDNFLPSSRSIAFKKSAWKAVGGYPENLYTGEDTLFDLKLKEKGFKFILDRKAVVRWRMRPGWKKFAKQFYLYGVGDRRARNILKLKGNLLMVLGFYVYLALLAYVLVSAPLLSVPLIALVIIYALWGGLAVFSRTRSIGCFLYGMPMVLVKRASYIWGISHG